MIWNVIDDRKRSYRWARVDAVVEDVAHDNCCVDADQAESDPETSVLCEARTVLSLHEAILWAESMPGRVTLYLYDQDTLHGDGVE